MFLLYSCEQGEYEEEADRAAFLDAQGTVNGDSMGWTFSIESGFV